MLGMNRVMLHWDTTVHLTTFLLNFPFDMTLMSGTLSGQYLKVTRSYVSSKAANNFVLPTRKLYPLFFFLQDFNKCKSQDTIFSVHFILCTVKPYNMKSWNQFLTLFFTFLTWIREFLTLKLYANFKFCLNFYFN